MTDEIANTCNEKQTVVGKGISVATLHYTILHYRLKICVFISHDPKQPVMLLESANEMEVINEQCTTASILL